jgi:hypothetical protein
VQTIRVTYGMPKSLYKVTFDMYQGALASFLNVFVLKPLENVCVRGFAASPQLYPVGPDWPNYRLVYGYFVKQNFSILVW